MNKYSKELLQNNKLNEVPSISIQPYEVSHRLYLDRLENVPDFVVYLWQIPRTSEFYSHFIFL